MTDPKLHQIVQRMIDAGEPEENIALVIREYASVAPMASHGPQERTWTDTAVDALPTIGGAVGGLAGTVGGPIGAIGGAALGGAGGEGFKQAINAVRGKGALLTPAQAATGIAKEGATQGAAEIIGQGTGRLLTKGAGSLYQRALKPTKAASKGDPARIAEMVQTGLSEGINPTPGGARKIGRLVSNIESQVQPAVSHAAQRGAVVDRLPIAVEAEQFAKPQFAGVAPKGDYAAIDNVLDEFLGGPQQIPVDEAFNMARKEGSILSKSFGQRGSAEVEARKAIRHGLRAGVGKAAPEIEPMLSREGRLHQLGKAVTDRARTGSNLDVLGLAPLANGPTGVAAFLLNRAPAPMSMAARGMYQAGRHPYALSNATRLALLATMTGDEEQPER